MAFKLGKRSRARLEGVHPTLVSITERAIEVTDCDFTVLEGVRTEARQRQLVTAGSSWTMDSRHLKGEDGYGHAVDLGAWVGGKVDWSWPLYFVIARAMQQATKERLGQLRWGGAWDRRLTATGKEPWLLSAEYIMRRLRANRKPNPDGPHFELPKSDYP